MHRQPLLQMLDRYVSRYPDEVATVGRVRALVDSHPECFERRCAPGHITASALVLSADRTQVLLLLHAKLGCWVQPGGHADGVTDVLRVALTEVAEETGVYDAAPLSDADRLTPFDIDVHKIPAHYSTDGQLVEPEHEHHDFRFLLVREANSPVVISQESQDIGWFSPAEVKRLGVDGSILRMLRKAEVAMQV